MHSKKTREIKWINFKKENFLTKIHFLPFQEWPKINFRTGKSLKLPNMQFHEKYCWTFSMKIKILLNFHGKYSTQKFMKVIHLSLRIFLPGIFKIFWPAVIRYLTNPLLNWADRRSSDGGGIRVARDRFAKVRKKGANWGHILISHTRTKLSFGNCLPD